jgi:hypothetical protein
MGLKVYNGSSWSSQATDFKLYNGSSWTQIQTAYVYDGSQWRQFWPEAPVNTVSPTVSFSQNAWNYGAGQNATVTSGTWTNSPTSYSYQWYYKPNGGSWTTVSGGTSSTLYLAGSLAGAQIKVGVTATNARGSTTVEIQPAAGSALQPQALSGLNASKTGYGQVSASWNSSIGATVYQIQYSMGAGYVNTTTTSTSWSISNITPGPTFSLYVAPATANNGWSFSPLPGNGQQVFVSNLP